MPNRTILLVEDNPDDEVLTMDALRQGGVQCRIDVTRDGVEAVDYLLDESKRKPSLVLLDLKLPKMSGFDVLQRIRETPRTRILPVVILTSSSEQEDVVRAYLGGANSYVRKPVDFDAFGRAVRELGQYWLFINEGV